MDATQAHDWYITESEKLWRQVHIMFPPEGDIPELDRKHIEREAQVYLRGFQDGRRTTLDEMRGLLAAHSYGGPGK